MANSDINTKMESEDATNVASDVRFSKNAETMENRQGCVGLLDLSDDVLLYILQHCSPRDLKALGFSCERLGNLISDHTLWQTVDTRDNPSSMESVKWLLLHALNSGTKELLLSGSAKDSDECSRTPVSDKPKDNSDTSEDCPGPEYIFTQPMLKFLKFRCPNLISLGLEYCNIDCKTTGISHFPPTLKKLSLRGVKFYNLPADKSVLFNIHCHLPKLEYLDLSECSWLEPLSMLTLSKIPNLKHLLMKDCVKMREFVAYASLATRYGFFKLQVLDLRGTPVGDSEVSAFGWLPQLQELYLSPCRKSAADSEKKDESPKVVSTIESWELEEPDYYKLKYQEGKEFDISENDNDLKSSTWTSTGSPNTLANSNMPSSSLSNKNKDSDIENGIKRKSDTSSSANNSSQQHGPLKKRKKPNDNKCRICGNERKTIMDNSAEHNNQAVSLKDNTLHVEEPDTSGGTLGSNVNNDQIKSSVSDHNEESNRLNISFKTCQCGNDDSNDNEPSSSNENKSDNDSEINNSTNSDQQPSTTNSNEDSNNRSDSVPANSSNDHSPILYVNLGSRRNNYFTNNDRYRMISVHHPMPEASLIEMLEMPLPQHLDPSALVTDSAIRRFGRAEGDVSLTVLAPIDDNVYHNARPDQSNLRILSATGYRDITNRTLVHLVSAAPHLRLIDFSGTRVTASGVENFRSMRPDCEVIFTDGND